MKKIVFLSTLIVILLTLTCEAQAELRLRGIMLKLEAGMETIVRSINLGDFEAIASKAREIADHEKPPMEERKRILSFLGEEANAFRETDMEVHSTALRLAQAAKKKDYEGVIKAYGDLLGGCVKCHRGYRAPIVEHFYGEKAGNHKEGAMTDEAMSIVKKFGAMVKPEMQKAMSSGGPVKAISVCSVLAPEIASELGRERGWDIKRVSLRPRNSGTAMPDAWEKKVLQSFDERQREGEDPAKMAYGEVVEGRFRFMKAQGVQPLCLKCHGKSLAPEVGEMLREIYPDDRATGYSLGEVRGAFSLSKGL
ncbi:MAG: DUF3365 domain-containing protein [Thermodesulfobacteriota bacterium]